MKKTVRDIFGDRVVAKTPDDGTPDVVILVVHEFGVNASANLTPLAALEVARALTKVAGRVLAKESR